MNWSIWNHPSCCVNKILFQCKSQDKTQHKGKITNVDKIVNAKNINGKNIALAILANHCATKCIHYFLKTTRVNAKNINGKNIALAILANHCATKCIHYFLKTTRVNKKQLWLFSACNVRIGMCTIHMFFRFILPCFRFYFMYCISSICPLLVLN